MKYEIYKKINGELYLYGTYRPDQAIQVANELGRDGFEIAVVLVVEA